MQPAAITICGAGIAGVACAYYLSNQYQQHDIVLIDKLAPLSFTTSQSGENFREYWPQPSMNDFVSHSIDLMEALLKQYPQAFDMTYFGYDFVSHHKGHHIFPTDPDQSTDTISILDDHQQIRTQKPYLDPAVQQVLHIHRAGAIDVYALGSLMLKLARANGVKLVQADITDIKPRAKGYQISLDNQRHLHTQQLILSGGPFTSQLAHYLDIDLPIYSVPQRKFVIPDPAGVIPRDMPFTIYADKQRLNWSDEELELINSDAQFSHLLAEYPAGLHIKPEGRHQIKLGWAFNTQTEAPQWSIESDNGFADIVMRGATRFIPGLASYVDKIPTPVVQFAGYYTRTQENLPVIGKLADNLHVVSALAGYGTMAACAAGELCADHLNQSSLPSYAKYFSPQRYQDSALMQEINATSADGQL